MRKWAKRSGVTVAILFMYLGTGYQMAVLSWDIVHNEESAIPVFDQLKKPTALSFYRALADTLWPISSRYVGFIPKKTDQGKTQLGVNAEKSEALIFITSEKDRPYYIFMTTFLWGPKVVFNLVVPVVLNLCFGIGIILYSILMFFWAVVIGIINVALSVFGSKI